MDDSLKKRIAKVPKKPGVYRWIDAKGTILYIGKAKDLRTRMKSYTQKAEKTIGPWKQALLKHIANFEITITANELEALMLETNLIKEHRPKYNVLMKDDKNYVYAKITMQDAYPRVEIVRQLEEKEAKYFGPFLSGRNLRRTLELLHSIFEYRACKRSIDKLNRDVHAQTNLCTESQIGKCNGLCQGKITQQQYYERIEEVLRFLRGDHAHVLERLKALMAHAAKEKKFEQAASFRDTLKFIQSLNEQQVVSGTSGENTDVFGVALQADRTQVVLLQERDGRIVQELHFGVSGRAESTSAVLAQFLPQYYAEALNLPTTILVSEEIEGKESLEEWLGVTITIPQRGKKAKLLTMAANNAEEKVQSMLASWEAADKRIEKALTELQEALDLPKPPKRIECYDISHLGGTETVGSMVVFISGKPRNEQYRSFTIRTLNKGEIDDYKALKEVLTRRVRHLTQSTKEWLAHRSSAAQNEDGWKQEEIALEKETKVYVIIPAEHESIFAERGFRYVRQVPKELKPKIQKEELVMMLDTKKHKADVSLSATPDLIVLDGGKGQLGIGKAVLEQAKQTIPLIALAKQKEESFGTKHPIEKGSEAQYLLMRMRDEAHRSANRHRERRLKHSLTSR